MTHPSPPETNSVDGYRIPLIFMFGGKLLDKLRMTHNLANLLLIRLKVLGYTFTSLLRFRADHTGFQGQNYIGMFGSWIQKEANISCCYNRLKPGVHFCRAM